MAIRACDSTRLWEQGLQEAKLARSKLGRSKSDRCWQEEKVARSTVGQKHGWQGAGLYYSSGLVGELRRKAAGAAGVRGRGRRSSRSSAETSRACSFSTTQKAWSGGIGKRRQEREGYGEEGEEAVSFSRLRGELGEAPVVTKAFQHGAGRHSLREERAEEVERMS